MSPKLMLVVGEDSKPREGGVRNRVFVTILCSPRSHKLGGGSNESHSWCMHSYANAM
jgi:hypothetical protein